jgi:predicted RNase H-like HicB family nuclease
LKYYREGYYLSNLRGDFDCRRIQIMKAPVLPAARYPLHVRWSDEDEAYLGSIPGLIGDCCHADTPEVVFSQLKEIVEHRVEHLQSELPVQEESHLTTS